MDFLSGIRNVTGPLTLFAFLSVVALGIWSRFVREGRGVEKLYTLFRDKIGQNEFNQLSRLVIHYLFITGSLCFVLCLLAWIGGEWLAHQERVVLASSQAQTVNHSVEELVAILEHRAERVTKTFEEAKDIILMGYPEYIGQDSTIQLVAQVDALEHEFKTLHQKNIVALRAGDITLAHELTSEIQELLWFKQHRDRYWHSEEFFWRYGSHVDYAPPNPISYYAFDYPGILNTTKETIPGLDTLILQISPSSDPKRGYHQDETREKQAIERLRKTKAWPY